MTEDIISVGQLTFAIRGLLEEQIGRVKVIGELSNFKQHSSGHRYFTLKDADAAVSCVMWRSRTLNFVPEDGMKVVISGRLSVYAPRGNYQVDVTSIQPDGVGDLHVAFEKLKKDLAARGWFDPSQKKPIPEFPQVVGIATAKTGAAVQDMLSTIKRRYPAVQVVFRQTVVQGDGSAADVARAIKDLNRAKVDVIIVGRGGGSIEDLWSFNTEVVAKAIYESETPVISAVGHETDTTIADFVADRRAETPTAAAEMVTPTTLDELLESIAFIRERIADTVLDTVRTLHDTATSFVDGSAALRIGERILHRAQRVDELTSRAGRAIGHHLAREKQHLESLVSNINTLHPHRPLRLGYAIVERSGKTVSAADSLNAGDEIQLIRNSETSSATITETNKTERNSNG